MYWPAGRVLLWTVNANGTFTVITSAASARADPAARNSSAPAAQTMECLMMAFMTISFQRVIALSMTARHLVVFDAKEVSAL
jgi:hypothetical protein